MVKPFIVLGAGITGLATAWKLSEAGLPVIVLEKNNTIGGMAGTFRHKEYLLDYGPHKIYSQLKIFEKIKDFLAEDLLTVKKSSKIRLSGKYLPYPFGIKDLLLTLNPMIAIGCGATYGTTSFLNLIRTKEDTCYEDYIINRFGKGTYNLVFGPYAEKAWGNPKHLDKSLAKSRIVIPSLIEMIKRMIMGDQGKKELSASVFFYPKYGAVEIAEKMKTTIEKNGNNIFYEATPLNIEIKNNTAIAIEYEHNGKKHKQEIQGIISTIPMREYVKLIPNTFKNNNNTTAQLQFRKLILLYIEVNKKRVFPENWIFFPEKKYIFNRLSEQKGFSEHMGPENTTVLCVEITVDKTDPFTKLTNKELFAKIINQLEECKILKEEDVLDYWKKEIEDGYPIYHNNYQEAVETYLSDVESVENAFSIGRQGMFNYVGCIDCIDMGVTTAEFIINKRKKEEWKEQRKQFENYVTID
ncbi:MAG: FAD-dependent oxidoreductase [Candidatus Woesearchaeota archaeon]|jgi:protoporphyrinogen oxidase